MGNGEHVLRVWGARGTTPTPGPGTLRYGGNTSCLAIALSDAEHLVLDAGSGMRLLGQELGHAAGHPRRYSILLSHYHFDHIEGLPFFQPLYDPQSTVVVHGFRSDGRSVQDVLESLIRPPYFPVPLGGVPARLEYVTLDHATLHFADVQVDCLPLRHPNGSLCYRLDHGGRRIVFATDHEHGDEEMDRALVSFAQGADHLIYDATYIPSEYEALRRGWGHSTWYAAVMLARQAGVRNLVLFHHHPEHSDAELEALLALARQEMPSTELAREGMELRF